MLLPGGVVRGGLRRRDYGFRPVDGFLEAALAEAATAPSLPEAVTSVLAAALAELAGEPAQDVDVRHLSVGDRQFLMRQLDVHLGRDPVWLTATCRSCGESFDFEVRQAELPVKEAGAGYPYAEVGALRLRVPTGADQEEIADLPDEQAVEVLLARCRVDSPQTDGAPLPKLTAAQVVAAEAALERVAPEVAQAALADCPACGASNVVEIDPYVGLQEQDDVLFTEVHRLASTYHWSESEILALSRARRQLYLRLIDNSRGLAQ